MTLQELYDSIGGSYDSAKRILQIDRMIGKFIVRFLDDTSCDRLLAAYEAGDKTGMFEGAHALKGVCANLGLNGLSEAASEIAKEFRGINPPTMDEAALAAKIDAIRETHARTLEGIRRYAAEQ